MTITSVASTTFLADTVNLIRNNLNSNITDPISATRPGGEKFVLTEYPKRAVTYPIITVTDAGITQPQRLGMQSESTAIFITLEIRIWAKNVVQRDELFDSIYTWLRTNQFGGSEALTDAELHDFTLNSVVNVNEIGQEGIKSKVLEVQFLFICS